MVASPVLIPGVIALHRLLARSRGTDAALLTVTAFGVIAPVVQSLGWVRWPLVVPALDAARQKGKLNLFWSAVASLLFAGAMFGVAAWEFRNAEY